jgi:hypothetical protein
MQKYEELKDAIGKSEELNVEEKTQSVKHIEEWIAEDKAFGLIYEELIEMNIAFKEIFQDLGLV